MDVDKTDCIDGIANDGCSDVCKRCCSSDGCCRINDTGNTIE